MFVKTEKNAVILATAFFLALPLRQNLVLCNERTFYSVILPL